MLKSAILAILPFFLLNFYSLSAQDGPPNFVREAVMRTESYLGSSGKKATEVFMKEAMMRTALDNKTVWIQKLETLRQELSQSLDGVGVLPDPDGFMLELNGPGGAKRLRVLLDREEQKIADFELLAPPPSLKLSLATLLDTFDSLATEGLSGLFFYKLKGEVILKKPFGMANRGLHLPNTENIIFGTGSRPIDYTVAAIQLLDQQGKLSLDDPITKFIDEVPDDKTPITIRHLMTGQSGLPDFFDNDEDWDPDLAWVDRHTAMQRMMNQKLLFKPGTADEHSHGAFGLLAAIIETVSNQAYYAFLREHFFDPAGMDRTGEYGEVRDLQVADFAVGGGPQKIGLPNIPPNWGPTSWLIKGSGGMYSTLGDLQKFYSYLRSGKVLDESHQRPFRQATVNLDGSMRGFELFSAYLPPDTELYLFLNETGDRSQLRALFRGLEALLPKDD